MSETMSPNNIFAYIDILLVFFYYILLQEAKKLKIRLLCVTKQYIYIMILLTNKYSFDEIDFRIKQNKAKIKLWIRIFISLRLNRNVQYQLKFIHKVYCSE